MGSIQNGEYIPGPNDFHVKVDESTGAVALEAGLGKDEPDKSQALRAQRAGEAKVAELHEQLEARGIELAGKSKSLELKLKAAEQREAELAAREARLAEMEQAAQKAKDDAELALLEAQEKADAAAKAAAGTPPASGKAAK